MPLTMAAWTEFRTEPPWPNQVITKNSASAIIKTAAI